MSSRTPIGPAPGPAPQAPQSSRGPEVLEADEFGFELGGVGLFLRGRRNRRSTVAVEQPTRTPPAPVSTRVGHTATRASLALSPSTFAAMGATRKTNPAGAVERFHLGTSRFRQPCRRLRSRCCGDNMRASSGCSSSNSSQSSTSATAASTADAGQTPNAWRDRRGGLDFHHPRSRCRLVGRRDGVRPISDVAVT